MVSSKRIGLPNDIPEMRSRFIRLSCVGGHCTSDSARDLRQGPSHLTGMSAEEEYSLNKPSTLLWTMSGIPVGLM
jgi:hypothetical protein